MNSATKFSISEYKGGYLRSKPKNYLNVDGLHDHISGISHLSQLLSKAKESAKNANISSKDIEKHDNDNFSYQMFWCF